jgi:hypothetical protein
MRKRIWKDNLPLLEEMSEKYGASISVSDPFEDPDGDILCDVIVHSDDHAVIYNIRHDYEENRVHLIDPKPTAKHCLGKGEVVKRLCKLCKHVESTVFNGTTPCDCFCIPQREENSFKFDEMILAFVESAVYEKIEKQEKQNV